MGKVALVVFLFSMLVMASVSQSKFAETRQIKGIKDVDLGLREKVTQLHFYFHDIGTGKKPSSIRVAQGPNSNQSQTLFGVLFMADDPLTEGPKPTSKLVGRAQGLYGSAGQENFGLIMAMSYWFIDGIYNGSTLSIVGRNPTLNPVREMPIVGGTGIFRFARGIATAKTYFIDASTGAATVEYNVTAIHY